MYTITSCHVCLIMGGGHLVLGEWSGLQRKSLIQSCNVHQALLCRYIIILNLQLMRIIFVVKHDQENFLVLFQKDRQKH